MTVTRIELRPVEPGSHSFAVRLLSEGEVQELAPLSEAVAQHIANCLRIKLALEAGTPPLAELALGRPLAEYEDMVEDLRGESLAAIMEAMVAAALEEGEGELASEGIDGGGQEPEDPAADGDSVVAGPQPGAADAAAPAAAAAAAAVKQEAASDQTGVSLQVAAQCDEQPPAALQQQHEPQHPEGPAMQRQCSASPLPLGGTASGKAGAAQVAFAAAVAVLAAAPAAADEAQDELLARKLQAELVAAERYGSRQRRTAAPAQGSLQVPTTRNWSRMGPTAQRQQQPECENISPLVSPSAGGGGNAAAVVSQEEGREDEQALPEFRGVTEGKGEEQQWLATIASPLDPEGVPMAAGKRWSGSVCICGRQEEAAVARDLSLLWREQRLGFLTGDITWQPEEYNFLLGGYHVQVDVMPDLLRCCSLSDLRKLLSSLRDGGKLADLASRLERNPLSRAVPPPPSEPLSSEAARQYHGVCSRRSQPSKLPWRALLTLRPGQNSKYLALFATSAQAAAAADMALIWKQTRHKREGDVEGQQYNFQLKGYQQDEVVWARLLSADDERDLRILFRKLRDCGWMEQLAQRQQGGRQPDSAADPGHVNRASSPATIAAVAASQQQKRGRASGAAVGPPLIERVNSSGGDSCAAATAVAMAAAAVPDGEVPARKRSRVSKAAASSALPGRQARTARLVSAVAPAPVPTAAAAPAVPAAGWCSAASEEQPDHVPLLAALSEAAKTAGGRQAGLTVALAATYLPALQTRSAAQQHQQISCLQLLLAGREYGGVVAMLQAAIKLARLE